MYDGEGGVLLVEDFLIARPKMRYSLIFGRDQQIETTRKDKFYWDEHGRRYSRGGCARASRASGELDVALEAVR